MRKKLILSLLCIVLLLCSGCSSETKRVKDSIYNELNNLSNKSVENINKISNSEVWFEDTGVVVKTYNERLIHIVRDNLGWLYYMQTDSFMIPVTDEEGNKTKDITIFEK